MKAIKFKEKELYSVNLNRGIYLIDGKIFEVHNYNGMFQVKDIKNIIPITRTTVVNYYTSNGDDKLSVKLYKKQQDALLINRKYDGDEYIWDSLDAEFIYRKFLEKWKPIKKNIEIKGEPYSVEIEESQIDTGNKFITSNYINGGKEPLLFDYNRQSALLAIVANKFKSLDMVFNAGISYGNTNNKRIWGNSTHSCIQYVVAFGTYIFSDVWKNTYNTKGDLRKLLSDYNNDKKALEIIIQNKYNVHFGRIDANDFDFEGLLLKLNHCKNLLSNVDTKNKTYDYYVSTKKKLNESISMVELKFKTK